MINLKNKALFFFCSCSIFLFSFSANSKSINNVFNNAFFKASQLDSHLTMSSWQWKEGLNDSLGIALSARLKWQTTLTQNLLFKADIKLNVSKSRLQTHIFGTSSLNPYSIKTAKLVILPTKNLELSLGILSQAFWKKNLLISSSSSFIGLRQFLSLFKTDHFLLNWQAEQSIPPSSSDDSYRLKNEKVPYFVITQIATQYQHSFWQLKSNVFYSRYFNLPSVVAFNSSLLGNHVFGDSGPVDSAFAYSFTMVGLDLDYYLLNLGLGLNYYLSTNIKAPKTVRAASFIKLYLDQISLLSQDLTLAVEQFFIEPDATVSYYNSAVYGNTNRKGFALSLSWKLNSFSQIKLNLIKSDIINKSIQDQLQSIFISMESKL